MVVDHLCLNWATGRCCKMSVDKLWRISWASFNNSMPFKRVWCFRNCPSQAK